MVMLNLRHYIPLFALLCATLVSCGEKTEYCEYLNGNEFLIQANGHLTNVMVHDIFSPPVASRIYAYASLAAYEVAVLSDDTYRSLMGQLNGFEKKEFDTSKECLYPLAALVAYYDVATAMIFSENMLTEHRDKLYQTIKKQGISKEVFENSLALGQAMASHVKAYASKDNYHQSRSFEKYTPSNVDGTWKPTPPAYMEGLEPHWATMRPFVMDSSNQFVPERPSPFEIVPKSDFYKEAEAVMLAGNNLTDEQREIAFFWDCNPYKVNVKGHVMYAEKKITPGGHWMGIAGIAAKTIGLDWKQTAEAFALTSLALYDGFLSCWDEKYRSVLIRPETYINLYMDEDWLPLLQTPPFPEYTSGHSVVSAAASSVLTHLLGDEVAFVDSTEVVFGLPVREFPSFRKAAEEAAISRFYGGIHYMPAIVNGMDQGDRVGQLIVDRIQTRSIPVIASSDGEN
ncbi:MAG TPA: vanadium-dependent haloperoxidase [Cyclobacteriaceae bacterium]|nr:vanadium-dependent haloperoxidase [Cyclobacteriaceae bacterium]